MNVNTGIDKLIDGLLRGLTPTGKQITHWYKLKNPRSAVSKLRNEGFEIENVNGKYVVVNGR